MRRFVSLLALALTMLAAPMSFADTLYYRATMSGPAEATPNSSPGYGVATVIIDDVALTMSLSIPFFDLEGMSTASHIHCCTTDPLTGAAGVATATPTFPGFPSGVHSGLYEQTFSLADAATYNAAFITANGGTVDSARASLLTGLTSNEAYLNVHSSEYPGGEIRGFLVAAPVPEPATYGMLAMGLAALGFIGRRRS